MTPEQFIFWISGYFSGARDNYSDIVVEDIRKALKEVKLTPQPLFVMSDE